MTLSSRYDPQSLEEKWQKRWAERGEFDVEPDAACLLYTSDAADE